LTGTDDIALFPPIAESCFLVGLRLLDWEGHLAIAKRSFDRRDSTRRPATTGIRAKRVLERPPAFQGWRTTDEEELERRRWRGRTEVSAVEPCSSAADHFASFRVGSSSGWAHEVEIRSLTDLENSCGCLDHRVNGLGTCKHVEGVLEFLRKKGARAFAEAAKRGSPWVELYLDRGGDGAPRLMWPNDSAPSPLRTRLARFVSPDGSRLADAPGADPATMIEAIRRTIAELPDDLARRLRISRQIEDWLGEQRRRAERTQARQRFLDGIGEDSRGLDFLRHPLLPYQREGMLHLAFGERALLADEMGLGKTIQAIAACDLLRRLRGVERVLVVSPASLKAEWEEQIARFSELPAQIIAGSRPRRLQQYREPAFFNLANYEQIVVEAPDINRILAPDIVILDEAQRIKNWQTKTARAVKSLASPYAFVLTGTPLENRIDEVYSIVQYLDPAALGPLFRFNRTFYKLDERGRPVDYKNLDELRRRLQPIMLRRRKVDVEEQLPQRTIANYFVGMTAEQKLRYEDYEKPAAQLIRLAQRRPLTKVEMDRLQQLLACMRMICDTPYILDPACRDSPKLIELEGVLTDLLAEPDRKIIIFSEWERMLQLVRELAHQMELDFAWHTGSVPQDKRRLEINRFKKDPGCRLFLSTDSGSVGLNLQAANAVINLDLPWNPAKLEQRIARAWRKNQMRQVSVVNLVCEHSIEHRILHLLADKQQLADGVLDGVGDLNALRMPSGRIAFLERLKAMMGDAKVPAATAPPPAPAERLRDELLDRHGDRLLLVERRRDAGGRDSILAVLAGDGATAAREQDRLRRENGDAAPRIEVVDRAAFEAIGRLVAAGLIAFVGEPQSLHRSPALLAGRGDRRRERARDLLAQARRKLRMATLLAEGGFDPEARPPLLEAIALAVGAALADEVEPAAPAAGPAALEAVERLVAEGVLPSDATALAGQLRDDLAQPGSTERTARLIELADRLTAMITDSAEPEPRALAAE
jgi:hypothetical protein